MFHNICRLCLSAEDLIWIFNDKMADNMPEIIQVTSGVEITKSDTITQMVCSQCCQITIKMFKFRTTSIKNDKDLKAKCAGYNVSQLKNSAVQYKPEPSSSAVPTSTHTHSSNKVSSTSSIISKQVTPTTCSVTTAASTIPTTSSSVTTVTRPVLQVQIPQKYKLAHPSIKEIFKKNPKIILPDVKINSHFGAYITLLTDEVDDWYKERNLSDKQIVEIKKSAADYAKSLENPPIPEPRKKRRKSSFESINSSSSSKRSSTPENSINENITSKSKRMKLNREGSPRLNVPKPVGSTSTQASHSSTINKLNNNIVIKANEISTDKVKHRSTAKFNVHTSEKTKTSIGAKPHLKTSVNSNSSNNSNSHKVSTNTSTKPKTTSLFSMKPTVNSNVSTSVTLNESATDKRKTESNKSSKSRTEPETRESESILSSLLHSEKTVKDPKNDITLTSILESNTRPQRGRKKNTRIIYDSEEEDDLNNDPVYEPMDDVNVEEDNSEPEIIETTAEESSKKIDDQVQYKKLFTTRPFVRTTASSGTHGKHGKSGPRLEIQNNELLLVLSDSDDDNENVQQSSNKNVNSGNSDPIIVDIDSSETSSSTSREEHGQVNPSNNMPDLSLVSVANKSLSLLICKVCDSHFNNHKDLKIHLRKTHTKCPFCTKKFRSLASRDEHVKHTCVINNANFVLKNPKLELIRVDEIGEIRKKYASAFEQKHDINENKAVEVDTQLTTVEPNENEDPTKTYDPEIVSVFSQPLMTYDPETASALSRPTSIYDLETVSAVARPTNTYDPETVTALSRPTNTYDPETASALSQPTKTYVPETVGALSHSTTAYDPETANTFSQLTKTYDSETASALSQLDQFLQTAPPVSSSSQPVKNVTSTEASSNDNPTAESIVESTAGNNNGDIICISDDEADTCTKATDRRPDPKPRINIINNDILQDINLHDNDVSVLQKILTKTKFKKSGKAASIDALQNNVILDGNTPRVKIFKNLRKHLQHYKIPIEVQYSPTLSVEYKYAARATPNKTTDLWYGMPTNDLFKPKPVTAAATFVPPIFNGTVNNSLLKQPRLNNSIALYSQPNSASQNVITAAATSVYQPKVNQSQGQISVAKMAPVGKGTIGSSANLIFTSQAQPLITTSNSHDHNYTNIPLLLNGANRLSTTTTNSNVTNFILVSSAIMQPSDKSQTNLPAAQGPLPIIQSVVSARELEQPTSTNNVVSDIPNSNPTVQTGIRVKNLSELS